MSAFTLFAAALLLSPAANAGRSSGSKADSEQEIGVADASRGVDRRVLWGHRFGSTELVDDPFITPYVDSNTEYGLYRYIYNWKGGGYQALDMAQVAQKFRLEVAFANRLAVGLSFQGAVQAASDSDTVLFTAMDGGVAGSGDLKLRVWSNNRFQVGVNAGASRSNLYTASPYNSLLKVVAKVEDLVAQGEIPTEKDIPSKKEVSRLMFDDATFFDMHTAVQGAWGIHPVAGVWTSVGAAYAESLASGGLARDLFAVGGVGLSLNAAPVLPKVPIGVVFAYTGIAPAEPTAGRGKEIRVGLFYTGRHYLDLGLEAAEHIDYADVVASKDTWQGSTRSVTRHYYSARTRVRVYF